MAPIWLAVLQAVRPVVARISAVPATSLSWFGFCVVFILWRQFSVFFSPRRDLIYADLLYLNLMRCCSTGKARVTGESVLTLCGAFQPSAKMFSSPVNYNGYSTAMCGVAV